LEFKRLLFILVAKTVNKVKFQKKMATKQLAGLTNQTDKTEMTDKTESIRFPSIGWRRMLSKVLILNLYQANMG